MWNVYVILETGEKLAAVDCGSEENAWDVLDHMINMDGETYIVKYVEV